MEMTATADEIVSRLVIGETRIQDEDGFVGTVAYVGPVASARNAQEIYAGVVWDDSSRGKHNGSVICRQTKQLVRHFHCSSPQGASFLRLSKLNLGVALDDALCQSQYVPLDAPLLAPNNRLPHVARTAQGRDKPIEFIGELKIRAKQQLPDLHTMSLRRMGISSVAMKETFLHVQQLDLAGNLLSSWETVLSIFNAFPNLEQLSLASNRIRDVPEDMMAKSHSASPDVVQSSTLRVLNLNRCSIQAIATLVHLDRIFPNLEELCLAYSRFNDNRSAPTTSNDKPLLQFSKLRFLDVSSCDWTFDDCSRLLSHLPCLEHLSLNDNPISTLSTTNQETATVFPALTTLQLAGTQIAHWKDLDVLNQHPSFQKIQSVRLQKTPLTAAYTSALQVRAMAIARFPNLQQWNASPIAEAERTEAEKRYVVSMARQQQEQNNTQDDNPRYWILKAKYPDLVDRILETNGLSNDDTTKQRMHICNITIRSMAADSCSMEPLVRRLPDGFQVGRLKTLCARSFGLDVDRQALYVRCEGDAFPTELDKDEHTLAHYGIGDGAEILMQEIDLEAKVKQEKQRRLEQEQRITVQEQQVQALQKLQQQQ